MWLIVAVMVLLAVMMPPLAPMAIAIVVLLWWDAAAKRRFTDPAWREAQQVETPDRQAVSGTGCGWLLLYLVGGLIILAVGAVGSFGWAP